MERINKYQLFCLMIIGQIGSTNLWALGIEAKQDAWIVNLISMLGGAILILMYTKVQSKFPNDNLFGILQKLLGKVISWPLALIYALTFLFNSTRNTSEFADLINMSFLHDTPSIVIKLTIFAVIIYLLFLGIETLARVTEITFPIIFILLFTIYILVIASGKVQIRELLPVLGNGILPVLKATYPININFPFGLAMLFFQIWPYASEVSSKDIRKISLISIFMSGIILSITLIIIITTLGTNLASSITVPFLDVIKLINIGDFLTNLDAIGVILIFTGGFYLNTFFFFSASKIIADLFKIKNYKLVCIPLALLVIWYTDVYEPNYPFHVKYLMQQYWQQIVPLFNVVFILLLGIMLLKDYCNRTQPKNIK